MKNDDIQDVMDKLRLNFAVSTLMSRYQQEANNRGISYTFRLRDVAMENSKPLNVPTIFRR